MTEPFDGALTEEENPQMTETEGRVVGTIGAETYTCAGCGEDINPVTQDYYREEGVPHPRRFHYRDSCAPDRLTATLFTADDPRSFHTEALGH